MYGNLTYNFSLYILSIFIFLIIIFSILFKKKTFEGFNAGDISGITNTVNSIKNTANTLPGKINSIGTNITNSVNEIKSAVARKVNSAVSPINSKITSVTGEITDIEGDITGIKGDITGIKGDIVDVPGLIDGKINQLKTEISNEITSKITSATTPLIDEITDIGLDIGDLIRRLDDIPQFVEDQIDIVKDFAEGLVADLRLFVEEQIDIVKGLIREARSFAEGLVADLRLFVNQQIGSLVTRIKRFGKKIGSLVNNGIVDPFKTLFEAIGNIFVQLFNIIIELGEKVKSMPGCIFLYMVQGPIDLTFVIIRWILPKFIEDFFKLIYGYTLKVPLEFIAEWSGYNDYYDTCYKFDVKSEVNSMKSGFNQASSDFKDSFGDMNFNDIF